MEEQNKIKPVSSFKDLTIWKMGKELAVDTYHLTNSFPQNERFGLVDQMRRAAVSIPANIAEGFNRKYSNDYKRFLHVSLGSCGELETLLELSISLNLLKLEAFKKITEKLDHESRMIRKLAEKISLSISSRKSEKQVPRLDSRAPLRLDASSGQV